jgi:large subunit ribosomal protein L34
VKKTHKNILQKTCKEPLLFKNKYVIITYVMSFTYKPSKRKRAKKFGFLSRAKTPTGRALVARRRQKGRKKLTASV